MRCPQCRKELKRALSMRFNEHSIDGWKCVCGERVYDGNQAQRILLLNKCKRQAARAKLGRIRSNLIVRVPKDVERALNLTQGGDVLITIEGDGMKISPA